MYVFYNDYIYAYNFFSKKKLFKLFISLEFKYNKLQFGLGISSIEVSKQKLCISTSLYVYNQTYSKEIHPGFQVSIVLLTPQRKGIQKQQSSQEETFHDGSCNHQQFHTFSRSPSLVENIFYDYYIMIE